MKLPRLKTVLLAPVYLFAAFYLLLAVLNVLDDDVVETLVDAPEPHATVVIFGASGTAGDGILKAALADPNIRTIHVITRRVTPRMEEGASAGKVKISVHMDYLDYSAVHDAIADVDAVYWALGTSSVGVDEETYGLIHVDFPAQFVREWLDISEKPAVSFHYISSSDISEDSNMMWAREKVRAENTLFGLADGTKLKVIAYRPDYIGPTVEEAVLGQDMLYWFFAPVRAAVRARQIGEAMIEITARGSEFENGDRVTTGGIIRLSDAYLRRQANH